MATAKKGPIDKAVDSVKGLFTDDASTATKAAKRSTKKTPAKKAAPKRATVKKTPAKKTPAKKASSKRTLVAPKGDKRYVRRAPDGTFKESDDVSKSLSVDARKTAKTKTKPGQGDKGDR